jgi:hypothetical protein
MPEIEREVVGDSCEFFLPGGPVGQAGQFDVIMGYLARNLSTVRGPGNEHGSAATSSSVPAETLIMDLLVHPCAQVPARPEVAVFGFPHGGPDGPDMQRESNRIPTTETVTDLLSSPPVVATSMFPRYPALVGKVFERMGWDAREFRGMRLTMRHPPLASKVVMRWPL